MKRKNLTIIIFVAGILTTLYGMMKDNNEVFIIGLVFIIVGYALVRTKLRRYFGEKS
ncbi:MAG: hypothetical protein JW896_11910 [Deltaproteobacteria bacterium]|nr:hypothetical protein [Deltaproteobacteria bacterium]